MTKYNNVKHIKTEEYFNGNQFSIDVFKKKYALHENESYVDAVWRVCQTVAAMESTPELAQYWAERWFDEIYNDKWHPAGSIMQGAGSDAKISLSNCTTISLPEDSLEAIMRYTGYRVQKAAAYRQGLGVHFSKLRPKSAKVNNSSKISSGATHWMGLIDSFAYYVGQYGRIPAFLFSLDCKHLDVEDFITLKVDRLKVQNANISVHMYNNIYEQAKIDGDWTLEFNIEEIKKGDKIYLNENWDDLRLADGKDELGHYTYAKFNRPAEHLEKTVKAKYIIELIAKNMHNAAEPGVQNIDIARKYSNSDAVGFPIIGTNACCCTGDTKILTDKGNVDILSCVNEKVNIWNGEKFTPVAPYLAGTNEQIYKVTLNDGSFLNCTKNHIWHLKDSSNNLYLKTTEELNIHEETYPYLLPDGFKTNKIIVSISKLEQKESVYCFTEKKNHLGCFNGIITGQSEQYLEDQGLCVLSSINAETVNFEELETISESIQRFLDNVVSLELADGRYATYEQKRNLESLRRIGAGISNLSALLFKNNMYYGSPEANALIEKYVDTYNYYLYKYSIKVGKEKGSFKAFVKDKYLTSQFIIELLERHPDLNFDTMRNVCVTSIAPTGSLSLMFRGAVLSYGIEPAFGLYYWKRTRISGQYEYYFVVPSIVKSTLKDKYGIDLQMKSDSIRDDWYGTKGLPIAKIITHAVKKYNISFKTADEVNYLEKLDLMARVQKCVDSSISVTYQLKEDSSWEETYDLIMKAYDAKLKSIAAFRVAQMYGIVSEIPFRALVTKLTDAKIKIHPSNFNASEAKELNLIQQEEIISCKNAPKRPTKLAADIYTPVLNHDKYVVAVGLLNNKPYEIFCGKLSSNLNIKHKEQRGIIEKIKRGHYALILENGETIEDFSLQLNTEGKDLFRMVSTSLRHGVDIKFIVEQLSKSTDSLLSLTAVAARILKKYIPQGETVTGQACPSCHKETLFYNTEKCLTCASCGWSGCN